MGTLGMQEMIVIFMLALVLFGPKKLPELGRTIGKAITEFRRASNDLKSTFEREMQTLERESQSVSQVAQITAGDIFERALNYAPVPENSDHPALASSPTATEPSTVDASAIPGVESNGTVEQAVSPPEPVPALEGTVPRS
jgi:TatA/E family protein of Tat protein translocase